MDIDNFEWVYSEGEAPDGGVGRAASRDVSSDEDETGNDAAVELMPPPMPPSPDL